MKTEAGRNLIRIIANYARLGSGLILGLIFVPFTLGWLGTDGLSVILLLGAGTGLAGMFREITSRAAVRELAAAHHSGDPQRFLLVYNSSLVVAAVSTVVGTLIFVILYFCIPALNIPPGLEDAARVLLVSQAVYLVISTQLSPIYNMLVVQERFARLNAWAMLERSTMLLCAVVLAWVFRITDPARGVAWWGISVAAMQLLTFLAPVAQLLHADRRLVPHLGHARREHVRGVFSTLKWYLLVESAPVMHERVGQFVANYFFGPVGSVVFGISLQFASYVRVATYGVTFGLDAVAARLMAAGTDGVRSLTHHSTRMQSLIALPLGLAIFVLAEPLITLWIATRVQNPAQVLPPIILCVRIMSVGVVVRAISEGWSMILYGAGFVRRYAPLVAVGGALNPVITTLVLLVFPALYGFTPPRQDPNPAGSPLIQTSAIMFSVLFLVVHGVLLPRVGAACLGLRFRDYVVPIARPLLATAIAAPVLLLPHALAAAGISSALLQMIITTGVFGVVSSAAAVALVLSAEERQRFVWSRMRQVLGRA